MNSDCRMSFRATFSKLSTYRINNLKIGQTGLFEKGWVSHQTPISLKYEKMRFLHSLYLRYISNLFTTYTAETRDSSIILHLDSIIISTGICLTALWVISKPFPAIFRQSEKSLPVYHSEISLLPDRGFANASFSVSYVLQRCNDL
jgi:hypothetical protein